MTNAEIATTTRNEIAQIREMISGWKVVEASKVQITRGKGKGAQGTVIRSDIASTIVRTVDGSEIRVSNPESSLKYI